MRNLGLLLFIVLCISCKAQKETVVRAEKQAIINTIKEEGSPIAKWNFVKEDGKDPNQYIITANLKLDKGWHIWDFNPGGDGLLIAPKFSFDSKNVEMLKKEVVGTLKTSKLAGMDEDVRYYENEVSFKVLVRSNEKKIKGSVYYQLCDHEKCLAPTEESFELN